MKQWYILFTNYENSLATMKRLVKAHLPLGCGAYIPVTLVGKRYHKTRMYNKPLYPFYLFVCCTDTKQLDILLRKMKALNIDGYFLQNADNTYATLTSDQIRHMETNLTQTSTETECPFAPGEEVVVVSGPMSGISGLVTSYSEEYVFISMCTKKGRFIELPVLVTDIMSKEI